MVEEQSGSSIVEQLRAISDEQRRACEQCAAFLKKLSDEDFLCICTRNGIFNADGRRTKDHFIVTHKNLLINQIIAIENQHWCEFLRPKLERDFLAKMITPETETNILGLPSDMIVPESIQRRGSRRFKEETPAKELLEPETYVMSSKGVFMIIDRETVPGYSRELKMEENRITDHILVPFTSAQFDELKLPFFPNDLLHSNGQSAHPSGSSSDSKEEEPQAPVETSLPKEKTASSVKSYLSLAPIPPRKEVKEEPADDSFEGIEPKLEEMEPVEAAPPVPPVGPVDTAKETKVGRERPSLAREKKKKDKEPETQPQATHESPLDDSSTSQCTTRSAKSPARPSGIARPSRRPSTSKDSKDSSQAKSLEIPSGSDRPSRKPSTSKDPKDSSQAKFLEMPSGTARPSRKPSTSKDPKDSSQPKSVEIPSGTARPSRKPSTSKDPKDSSQAKSLEMPSGIVRQSRRQSTSKDPKDSSQAKSVEMPSGTARPSRQPSTSKDPKDSAQAGSVKPTINGVPEPAAEAIQTTETKEDSTSGSKSRSSSQKRDGWQDRVIPPKDSKRIPVPSSRKREGDESINGTQPKKSKDRSPSPVVSNSSDSPPPTLERQEPVGEPAAVALRKARIENNKTLRITVKPQPSPIKASAATTSTAVAAAAAPTATSAATPAATLAATTSTDLPLTLPLRNKKAETLSVVEGRERLRRRTGKESESTDFVPSTSTLTAGFIIPPGGSSLGLKPHEIIDAKTAAAEANAVAEMAKRASVVPKTEIVPVKKKEERPAPVRTRERMPRAAQEKSKTMMKKALDAEMVGSDVEAEYDEGPSEGKKKPAKRERTASESDEHPNWEELAEEVDLVTGENLWEKEQRKRDDFLNIFGPKYESEEEEEEFVDENAEPAPEPHADLRIDLGNPDPNPEVRADHEWHLAEIVQRKMNNEENTRKAFQDLLSRKEFDAKVRAKNIRGQKAREVERKKDRERDRAVKTGKPIADLDLIREPSEEKKVLGGQVYSNRADRFAALMRSGDGEKSATGYYTRSLAPLYKESNRFYKSLTKKEPCLEWFKRPMVSPDNNGFVFQVSGKEVKVGTRSAHKCTYSLDDLHNHREFRIGEIVWAKFQKEFWPGYIRSFIPAHAMEDYKGDGMMISWIGETKPDANGIDRLQHNYVCYADVYHFDMYFSILYMPSKGDKLYPVNVAMAICWDGRPGYWEEHINKAVYDEMIRQQGNVSSIPAQELSRIHSEAKNRNPPPSQVTSTMLLIQCKEVNHFGYGYNAVYSGRNKHRFVPKTEVCEALGVDPQMNGGNESDLFEPNYVPAKIPTKKKRSPQPKPEPIGYIDIPSTVPLFCASQYTVTLVLEDGTEEDHIFYDRPSESPMDQFLDVRRHGNPKQEGLWVSYPPEAQRTKDLAALKRRITRERWIDRGWLKEDDDVAAAPVVAPSAPTVVTSLEVLHLTNVDQTPIEVLAKEKENDPEFVKNTEKCTEHIKLEFDAKEKKIGNQIEKVEAERRQKKEKEEALRREKEEKALKRAYRNGPIVAPVEEPKVAKKARIEPTPVDVPTTSKGVVKRGRPLKNTESKAFEGKAEIKIEPEEPETKPPRSSSRRKRE